MNNKTNISIKEIANITTSVMPVALSMAVCAGMGAFAGAVISCIYALICTTVDIKKQMPLYASFVILTFLFKEFGASTASLSIVICGVLLAVSSLFYNKIKEQIQNYSNCSVEGTVMLLCALTVTILFTTDYFGIGATGNISKEMIESYLSLGFHPNWRGVLYGTIVMVVMITFPRKFKKGSKIINSAFIALIITTALNYFLNPSDMISAINEIGPVSFTEYKNSIFIPLFNNKPSVFYSVIGSISLYLIGFYILLQNENCKKTDFISSGISNCITGFGTCMITPNITKKHKLINGLFASLLIGVIFLVFNNFISRIPVHSCAVVLIVGAWQSVKWSEVKKIFSSALNIFVFAVIMIFGLLKGFIFVPVYALTALIIHKNEPKIKIK